MFVVEASLELLKAIIPIVGFIFWLSRLEFMTKQNKHDIAMIWRKHDDLDKMVMDKLSKIESSLSRIEGRLSASDHD